MTNKSNTNSRRRSRPFRSSSSFLSTTVTLMLTYNVTPSQCFNFQQSMIGMTTSTATSRPTTRRFFRDTADSAVSGSMEAPWLSSSSTQNSFSVHTIASAAAATVTEQEHYEQQLPYPQTSFQEQSSPEFLYQEAQPQFSYEPLQQLQQQQQEQPQPFAQSMTQAQPQHALPTWLQQDKSSQWESNWYKLEEAMLSSFFTPQETQRLLYTIEEASGGCRHQMASAAEFCLILVESMEMGLTALKAAVHHVCACVTARQQQALQDMPLSTGSSSSSSSPFIQHPNPIYNPTASSHLSEDESDPVVTIARDAGRLKSLEMVAAMIYSDKAASRVTPDKQDAENLKSLLLTETKDWRALAIRTAAALYRLKGILQAQRHASHSFSKRHVELTLEAMQCSREALYIYAPLASRLGMHRLKNELEGAAFRILYRRQYEKVNRMARELRPRHSRPHLNRGLVEMCDNSLDISSCMKNVLESVKADMTQLLQNDDHFREYVQDFTVTARVKEPYSLWKKMLRNRCQHVMEVPDAIALRIVLDAKRETPDEDDSVKQARERALCYYAQQLCMQHWQPVEGNPRFKDYIEHPKRNGYQSLHYTAHTTWDSEDWNLEIQVRSGEMHQVAEFGLASHWEYKAQQKLHQAEQQKHHRQDAGMSQTASPEVTIGTASASANTHYSNNDAAYRRGVQEWRWQQHAGGVQDTSSMMMDYYQNPPVDATSVDSPNNEQEQAFYGEFYQQAIPHDEAFESSERADRIRARTKKLQPYIEALTAAQSDLAREHVFVFLTSEEEEHSADAKQPGRVLALPSGACVLDALREGQRQWGFPLPDFIRLNGELSSKVTHKLQNGDILTVPRRAATPTMMA